ncbi:MAG: aminotransferase class V-fold PLP-dependent enzyme [Bryobacteraceae bacterium]
MAPDWKAIRAEFPALARWTYLNSATFGQVPRRAVDAVMRHFARRDELACYDFIEWYDDVDVIRADIAKLIRCRPEDIAFVTNAASALGLLVAGMEWRRGDRILTPPEEFPNQHYLPSLLQERGVELVEAPVERLADAIDERTRVVALSEVNYSTGVRAPVERIARAARECGALSYIDGTQSTGALRFDAERVQPDMFAVHGYKWLISPNGAGFMYVSQVLREKLAPAVVGWRSDRNWRNTENLAHGRPQFKTEAEKYEGGSINFPSIYGMGESVRMILEIGPEVIERRVLGLAAKARALLAGAGGGVAANDDSQIVTACFDGIDVRRLAAELKNRGVLVAARKGRLRVSPHFYNDEADLEKLVGAVRAIADIPSSADRGAGSS